MDGRTPELCGECGFDGLQWRRRDAATLLDSLGYWWRLATAGLSAEQLNRRPEPGVWSALEYAFHTSFVTAVIRSGVEMILAADGCALPAPPPAGSASPDDGVALDPDEVVEMLDREGRAMAAVAQRPTEGWSHEGSLPDGTVLQAEALLVHCAHDASHHHMDIGRGLARLGFGTPRAEGTVSQVNVSLGGVPKRPVASADVGWDGLDGDRQADRKHHGRPFQAVSLWSAEVIAELAGVGHPISAGAAGENLTLSGIPWGHLRPGSRLQVGTALLELSYPAIPCHKQAGWFSDGDFTRIAHDRNPGQARWYAWVRQPGSVSAGDTVVLQP